MTVRILLLSSVVWFSRKSSIAQDTPYFQAAIGAYLTQNHNDYESLKFGEFFEQPEKERLSSELGLSTKVHFSASHTFRVGQDTFVNEYFHFDSNLVVINETSNAEMTEVAMRMMFGAVNPQWTSDSLEVD